MKLFRITMFAFLAIGPVAFAQVRTASTNLKVYQSKYLAFYFSSGFSDTVRALSEDLDTFLDELIKEAGIPKPKEAIRVSIGKRVSDTSEFRPHLFEPPWLLVNYNLPHNRIDVRIQDMDALELSTVAASLAHHLIHYLIANNPQKPPHLIEEGLAQYYVETTKGKSQYLAIRSFGRNNNLQKTLSAPHGPDEKTNFEDVTALSHLFMLWLDETMPGIANRIFEDLGQGKSWASISEERKLPPLPILIGNFEAEMKPRYGLHKILLLYDFWFIIGCLALISLIALYTWKAIARAWEITEDVRLLQDSDPEPLIDAEELQESERSEGKRESFIPKIIAGQPAPPPFKNARPTLKPTSFNAEVRDIMEDIEIDFDEELETGIDLAFDNLGPSKKDPHKSMTPILPPPKHPVKRTQLTQNIPIKNNGKSLEDDLEDAFRDLIRDESQGDKTNH